MDPLAHWLSPLAKVLVKKQANGKLLCSSSMKWRCVVPWWQDGGLWRCSSTCRLIFICIWMRMHYLIYLLVWAHFKPLVDRLLLAVGPLNYTFKLEGPTPSMLWLLRLLPGLVRFGSKHHYLQCRHQCLRQGECNGGICGSDFGWTSTQARHQVTTRGVHKSM